VSCLQVAGVHVIGAQFALRQGCLLQCGTNTLLSGAGPPHAFQICEGWASRPLQFPYASDGKDRCALSHSIDQSPHWEAESPLAS
jgi:hypothetical protein